MFDYEIIRQCQKDLSQADTILKDFEPLLLANIQRLCFYGDVEELLQEGREEILNCILEFDGRAPFAGFLKSRLYYFYLNKMKEKREYPQEPSFFEKISQKDPLIEDFAIRKEEIKALEESLLCLTPQQKRVIQLYFYENYTLREIADILEISISTVQVHQQRALKKLRKELERRHYD